MYSRLIPKAYLIEDEEQLEEIALSLERPPRSFTDMRLLLRGGYHVLIHGRTGSGKTTLLLNLLRQLYESGHRILHRDDGGLEFLYLAREIPMVAWIPEGCELYLEQVFDIEVRKFREPMEILNSAFNDPVRFHAVIYDAYCFDPGSAAAFYAALFQSLIFKCMQTPPSEKERLVFSIDELNDIVQPQGQELTREHSKVRSLIEYNIRKLRKHKVTLLATTHRFKQLGLNVRSQFSYIFIKQSFGWDVYEFVNKNLITAANEVFWRVLKDLTTMGPEYVYAFDYKGNFDRFTFPDIPRTPLKYRLEGQVDSAEIGGLYDSLDIQVAYLRGMGLSFTDIEEKTGIPKSTAHLRWKRIKSIVEEDGET